MVAGARRAAPALRGVRAVARGAGTGTSSRRGGTTRERAIRENGVTYNVYGDPQGIDRPWELDMVPLSSRADEWSRLEDGA